VRILIFLNVSASKNLRCDSGLIQTVQMMDYMLKRSKDYHFYIWIPDFVGTMEFEVIKEIYPILNSEHVTVKYAPMSPIRRIIPYEFNFDALLKTVDFWGTDYDLVFNTLPEYTNNLSQLLCRSIDLGWGHASPVLVNRNHWLLASNYVALPDSRIEFRQVEGFIFAHYNTFLCNYNKEMMDDMIKTWFGENPPEIGTSIKLYNGVDLNKITKNRGITGPKNSKIRLLFPNRLQTFKNPMFLLDNLIKLRAKRQDFELILTDPTADYVTNNVLKNKKLIETVKANSDWISVCPVSGDDYYRMIYSSDVVINTSDYETWCVSITEALCCGKNCVVPSGLTFEEMTAPDYPFIYKKGNSADFIKKLELAIDKCKDKDCADVNFNYGAKYDWNNVVTSYLDFFENIRKKHILDISYSSKDRDRCVDYVKNKGWATKKEIRELLGPGEEKCWTKYRWRMLQSGIKDDYSRSEPIFYYGDKPDLSKQEKLF